MRIQDQTSSEGVGFTVRLDTQTEGETTIVLAGEIDISSCLSLRDSFLPFLEGAPPRVHVDLSQVTFLDSSAIGQLIAACKRVKSRGGSFSMTCGSSRSRQVLEIEGLIEYLGVRD